MNRLLTILFILFLTDLQAQVHLKNDSLAHQADSTIFLKEIRIVAYRGSGRLLNVPGSLSVLNPKELHISDGTSLASVINTVPGINMQTGTFLTSRIVIRGMGSRTPYGTNRIRTYLNDIPLTTADGVSTPEEIDLTGLDKIEVIKGPSSALYGSGLGGSLNIYTREALKSGGSVIAQYGSFNTFKGSLSGSAKTGKLKFWGSLSHLNSEGYRENNKYKRTSLLSTAGWVHEKWSLNSTFLLIDVDGGIPSSIGRSLFETNPKAAAPNWNAIGGFKKYRKGVASISLKNRVSGNFSNEFALFGRWNDSYEKRPFNNLDDESLSAGIKEKITWYSEKTEITAGAEMIAEEYKWKLDNNNIRLNENKESRYHLNIHAMALIKPVPRLNISLAGALNRINYRLTDLFPADGIQSGRRNFPVIISPRLGINYSPTDKMAFYASAGHGFSLPSPEETLLPEGAVNPEIKPEQGFQYEIGSRFNLVNRILEIDAAFYLIELKNLLVTKRITEDIFTGINAGRTRHKGVELNINARIFDFSRFPGRLLSTLTYSGSINRFVEFTDYGNNYNGNYLPGIPDQSLNLQVRWLPMSSLEILAHFQYTGDQYLNDSNEMKYQAYSLSNVKISYDFRVRKRIPINIYAGINNLSNTHYASMLITNAIGFNNTEPRYYYPGLPRHYYAGVQCRF
ncbi:MAG: TonB-dependent receptor [Bacteroidales bacterium]|nr:TonB-dependent receptor [Bacteroidales bacterium]